MPSTPMDEQTLIALLREEASEASSFYSSELAEDQTEAMERYTGELYGDEVEGRSRVTSNDIRDTINWIMPQLMRLYLGNDDLIAVEDEREDEGIEQVEADAANYLRHIFFKKHRGAKIIHDFAFDGLLQRIGVASKAWEDPKPSPPKIIEGVYGEQLQKYMQDHAYEIIEQESELDSSTQQEVFSLKVVHTPKIGRLVFENVPPEEFRIASRASDIAEARYHARESSEFASELALQFPDYADRLMPGGIENTSGDDGIDEQDDPRFQARFEDDSNEVGSQGNDHESRREVTLHREYIRVDYDGDGIVELRQIKRVGNIILENIVVDESEFVIWSPIRVAHKQIGVSLADTLMDLQKIRTVLMRKMLDGLSYSLDPRTFVDKSRLEADEEDKLFERNIGDTIFCKGSPRDIVHTDVSPDVSGPALMALEYMDSRTEEASGVTRHAQGLKAEAITDTKGGIAMLQAAANSRIELIARWLADGVEELLEGGLRLIASHQDQPTMIKVNGRPTQIDPRTWSDEMTVSVHVGAIEDRNEKLSKLNLILDSQKEILIQMGPSNPLVSLKELRHTLSEMATGAGFRDSSRFYKDLPEDYEPPQQEEQPDPKMIEAQAKMELAQTESQHRAKMQEAELQHKIQVEQVRAATDQQKEQTKAQMQQQIAVLKMQSEREIAELRIASEQQIARERMTMENELATQRAAQEMELARTRDNAAVIASSKPKSNGYRPGGDLSK